MKLIQSGFMQFSPPFEKCCRRYIHMALFTLNVGKVLIFSVRQKTLFFYDKAAFFSSSTNKMLHSDKRKKVFVCIFSEDMMKNLFFV